MTYLRKVRTLAQKAFSFLPFTLALKMAELLRGSQGFGSGASVSSSGEIAAIKRLFQGVEHHSLNIFDVGANRGEYTQALLPIFPNAKFFAFEPSPETFKLLRKNLAEPTVTTINFGLGEREIERPLYKGNRHARIGSLTKLPMTEEKFTEIVRIKKLDQFFFDLDIRVIDLLKIVVEGHELDVLKGSVTLLDRRLFKNIQFEFGEFNIYTRVFFKDLYDFLRGHGFPISIIKYGRLIPLNSYKPRFEAFAPTNFIAQLNSS